MQHERISNPDIDPSTYTYPDPMCSPPPHATHGWWVGGGGARQNTQLQAEVVLGTHCPTGMDPMTGGTVVGGVCREQ